jgi:hypothetical protein
MHLNWRKDWNVKNGEDAFRKFFRLFEFQGNAAETQIQHASATTSFIADHRIGIGTEHRNPFGFPRNGVGRRVRGDGNLTGG